MKIINWSDSIYIISYFERWHVIGIEYKVNMQSQTFPINSDWDEREREKQKRFKSECLVQFYFLLFIRLKSTRCHTTLPSIFGSSIFQMEIERREINVSYELRNAFIPNQKKTPSRNRNNTIEPEKINSIIIKIRTRSIDLFNTLPKRRSEINATILGYGRCVKLMLRNELRTVPLYQGGVYKYIRIHMMRWIRCNA